MRGRSLSRLSRISLRSHPGYGLRTPVRADGSVLLITERLGVAGRAVIFVRQQVARMERSKIRGQPLRMSPAFRFASCGLQFDDPGLRCAPSGLRAPKSRSPPPLAEIHPGFADIARPVGWQQAAPDIGVQRRVRPIARPAHQSVLDRIEVDVVDVSLEILLVPNGVFPKAPLPQRIFAIAMALDRRAGGDKTMRDMRLDPPPAAGEIGIAGWQRPDGMQVIPAGSQRRRS